MGCVAQDDTIDIVFDPCASLGLIVDGEASDAERAGVEVAVEMWNASAGTHLTTTPAPDAPRIPIRFEDGAAVFYGIYLDEEGAVVINHALTDERGRAITIAHEVGHAFGLIHVDASDGLSLMNPGNLDQGPTLADLTSLASLWGECPALEPQ
jgi:hypothetical protein